MITNITFVLLGANVGFDLSEPDACWEPAVYATVLGSAFGFSKDFDPILY